MDQAGSSLSARVRSSPPVESDLLRILAALEVQKLQLPCLRQGIVYTGFVKGGDCPDDRLGDTSEGLRGTLRP